MSPTAQTVGAGRTATVRHHADEREVLLTGQEEFEGLVLDGPGAAEATPSADGPMAQVEAAIGRAATMVADERRPWSRRRQAVLDPHLAERELLELPAVAAAMTRALVERDTDPTAAALAAETGVTVFRTAVTAWVVEGEDPSFPEIRAVALEGLPVLVAGAC